MSGALNFLGAVIVGTAVAMVITKVIPENKVTMHLILAALVAGATVSEHNRKGLNLQTVSWQPWSTSRSQSSCKSGRRPVRL